MIPQFYQVKDLESFVSENRDNFTEAEFYKAKEALAILACKTLEMEAVA